eukprot:m.6221 g.6221  ORF g.6221 m.6221 type:complete len:65 (-) comp8326_c0_seq1:206-400(-)
MPIPEEHEADIRCSHCQAPSAPYTSLEPVATGSNVQPTKVSTQHSVEPTVCCQSCKRSTPRRGH